MKRLSIFLVLMAIASICFSQEFSGKVVDENGNTLVGASVVIENSYLGTTTDKNGYFIINCKQKNCKLLISFVGYETLIKELSEDFATIDLGILKMKPAAYMSDEVIVKATRADNISPVTYSSLSNEELRKRNTTQDLPYLLELTPSFVATSESGTGIGYTNYRIRGTDPSRINVTINGIPLNDSESQTVFWVNMPDFASSVSNVQITRGVGTSTNGAASFGGSMNFFTGSLNDKPYGEVTAMGGSFNTFRQNVSIGTGILDNGFSFDLRMSNLDSDGYVENSFSKHQAIMMTSAWRGKDSFVRFNLIHGRERTGISWWGCPQEMLAIDRTYNPAGEYFDELGNRQYYKDQTDNYIQTHYQLLFSKNISQNLDLNAAVFFTRGDGYYEQYKQDKTFAEYILPDVIIPGIPFVNNNDTINPPNQIISSTDFIQRKMMGNNFYGTNLSANYQKAKLRLSFGTSLNQYNGDHFGNIIWMKHAYSISKDYKWYSNNGLKTEFAAFTKANYELATGLFAYADIQYRNVNYVLKGKDYDLDNNGQQKVLDQEHVFNFVNPKAGFYYNISENMQTYASFAVSQREPTRTNFKDAIGDPNKTPKSEKLNNYEFGYTYQIQKFALSTNLYYMDYIDQLVPTGEKSSVGYDIMTNVPESYRAGIEISAGYKPISKLSLNANITLSQNKIKNFTAWSYTYDDDWNESYDAFELGQTDIAYSPNIISSGIITFKPISGLNISWISKYVGEQFFDNTSSQERKLDAYFLNNLQIDYSFETKFVKEIQLKFIVNNIFNLEYSNNAYGGNWYEQGVENTWAYYYPQAGINFMGGLVLKF